MLIHTPVCAADPVIELAPVERNLERLERREVGGASTTGRGALEADLNRLRRAPPRGTPVDQGERRRRLRLLEARAEDLPRFRRQAAPYAANTGRTRLLPIGIPETTLTLDDLLSDGAGAEPDTPVRP
ncbi:MAG: hypothetical protein AAGC57_02480 [Pseudomonadota bacterium]